MALSSQVSPFPGEEPVRREALRVFVRGLEVQAGIGVYDHEHGRLQRLVIDEGEAGKRIEAEKKELENRRDADVETRVARLVEDPALRGRMGRAGLHRVSGRSWSALTHQLVGHYEDVLGGRVA